MVNFLIKRPIAVFMATFAFLLMGIVASSLMPTSLMPDISIPEITVQLAYPNNTARELETNVVRPLRNQLLQVADLRDIQSETRDGFSTIKLSFKYGTDVDYAAIETNEKIDASLNYLPRDIERPRVIKASATDIPVLNVAITLNESYNDVRFMELSRFAKTVLKKRIEQLPDVAIADLSGTLEGEILVTPNSNKLKSLGISNDELVNAIKENNFELGNLLVQNGIYQYNFKFSNPLSEQEDIENIYLKVNKNIFQLKELATISKRPQQERGLTYLNGERALVLSIIKKANAQVSSLKKTLEELTQSFRNDYPAIGFSVNQDQTKLLKLSLDNLKYSLLLGSFLAVLIMFLFLKELKSPLIIAVSIPVSLVISILFLYLFGLSINIISLSGLILGVGMMIDNSIIVIDNISQKMNDGNSLAQACVKGTNEIISPLISSVLTTCSVFLPLLFLSGITGTLFYDQAIAVSVGLGSSLLVSIIIVPVLYKILNERKSKLNRWLKGGIKINSIDNWYTSGYEYFFKKRWIVYVISIVSVLLAIVLFNTMSYTQLPQINQDETILNIEWNENINVFENQRRIESITEDVPSIETKFSQVGEQQFLLQRENNKSFSEAEVYLKVSSVKELLSMKNKVLESLEKTFPTADYTFSPPKNIFEYLFGNDEAELIAEVYSTNSREAPSETELPSINSLLSDKTVSNIPVKETAFIEVLHENLMLYDVPHNSLINELKTAFNQNFVDNLKMAEQYIPIKLSYDFVSLDSGIKEIFVKNKEGVLIPVVSLIKIHQAQQFKSITSNKKGEYLGYDIVVEDDDIEEQMADIQNKFTDLNDVNVRFAGSWLNLDSLKSELLIVVLVAILLLYFIMAAQFESLWQPIIILLEIPIDIGGALLVLWLFGGTINIMAAIGIVVMSGVIINDSILKLHTINLLRKKGHSIDEAIKMGGQLRLKPILMTSLTTILALSPFLFMSGLGAELQKPLAYTVIGGMILGTFISLYFIPLMYKNFSKKEV